MQNTYATHNSSPLLLALFIGVSIFFGLVAGIFGGLPAIILFVPIFPAIFILRDFRVGVVILMLLIAFQHTPFLPSTQGFNIVNYLVAATLLSFFVGSFRKKWPTAKLPDFFYWAYLIPIFLAALNGTRYLHQVPQINLDLIGLTYATPRSYLTGQVIKPFFIVLLAWLLATASLRSKRPDRFLVAIVIAMILPACVVIGYVGLTGLSLDMMSSARARSMFAPLGLHANEFAILFATNFTILLFSLSAVESAGKKILFMLALCLSGLALLLTFSRGGYVIAGVGTLAYVLHFRKLSYLVIACLVLPILLFLAPDAFWDRVLTGITHSTGYAGGKDELTAGRIWVWKQLLPEFWSSPLIGSGVGSVAWSGIVKSGLLNINHPHNLYFRVLLDMGLLGFCLLAVFVFNLFRNLHRIAKSNSPKWVTALASGTFAALAAYLLAGWTNGQYISESEISILWLCIGLLLPYFSNTSVAVLKVKEAR